MNDRKKQDLDRVKGLSKYVKLQALAKRSKVNKSTIRNALYQDTAISQEKLKAIQTALDEMEQFFNT